MEPLLGKELLWRSVKNDMTETMERKNIHKEINHGLNIALGGDEDNQFLLGYIYREEPRPKWHKITKNGKPFMEVPSVKAMTLMDTDADERVNDLPRNELKAALSEIMHHLKGMTVAAMPLKGRSMLHVKPWINEVMKPWNERT